MFKIPFNYDIDPVKSTVSVSLTKAGYLKIFFWSVAPVFAMIGIGELIIWSENRNAKKSEYPVPNVD